MEAFFPSDKEMKRLGSECHPDPEKRLAQQPRPKRFGKANYRDKSAEFGRHWARISSKLSEAARFEAEFEAVVGRPHSN